MKTGIISWTSAEDTGHGTHVAGTIAAVNNNNEGYMLEAERIKFSTEQRQLLMTPANMLKFFKK